jgi:hypothetical protein
MKGLAFTERRYHLVSADQRRVLGLLSLSIGGLLSLSIGLRCCACLRLAELGVVPNSKPADPTRPIPIAPRNDRLSESLVVLIWVARGIVCPSRVVSFFPSIVASRAPSTPERSSHRSPTKLYPYQPPVSQALFRAPGTQIPTRSTFPAQIRAVHRSSSGQSSGPSWRLMPWVL